MLAIIQSAGLWGIEAYPIRVEVDIADGLPMWATVGLADSEVRESKDRVVSALKNSGYPFERRKITINLSPANVRKEGTAFDLPIALGLLAASEMIPRPDIDGYVIMGELSLDGTLCPIRGALPTAIRAAADGARGMILPKANAAEAAIITDLPVMGIRHLAEAVTFFRGLAAIERHPPPSPTDPLTPATHEHDLADVRGQSAAKRALEIAAAGGHNLIFRGPPGTGKTMLAERLPTILPPPEIDERIEITKIYSISGLLHPSKPLAEHRPFRAPHHTVSTVGLIGGGPFPKPGEVTLAHRGVLFLDELPEFRRDALEALRQPMETGWVTITRARASLTYPARLTLVAAMNNCRCGFFGSNVKTCLCTAHEVRKYRGKVSGPLLDRIDLQVELAPIRFKELNCQNAAEPSHVVQTRVLVARERQSSRYKGTKFRTNGDLTARAIRQFCKLEEPATELLGRLVDSFHLSARGHDRLLKVARTIADLAGSETIQGSHLAEAAQYRFADDRYN